MLRAQALIKQRPDEAKQMLTANPQLCYALLQVESLTDSVCGTQEMLICLLPQFLGPAKAELDRAVIGRGVPSSATLCCTCL